MGLAGYNSGTDRYARASGLWYRELSTQGGGLFKDASLPFYIPGESDASGPEPINRGKAIQPQPVLITGKYVVDLAFLWLGLD